LAVKGVPRRAAAGWERFAARWTDAVVCVSEGERELGAKAGIQAAWRVIPNGVDVSAIGEAGPEDRQAARRQLDLPTVPIVVCAGRICDQKGQDVLLDIWPLVLEKVPEARLVFVGGGPDLEELRRRAGGGVLFAGYRDDVVAWLDAADVVAIPSRWEGMSLVMLDAITRGRSVVSTDVPGASEALGSLEGAVVPKMDRPAFARALALRLASPERAAAEGRANRLTAERSFDVRRTLAQTANLYAEVIGRRMARRL
jgi:glycosyltransferase involved in cell wall biosynthesis